MFTDYQPVDAHTAPENFKGSLPRNKHKVRDSAMLRRRSEKGYDAIPNLPQCPSRVVSSSDEASRAWQMRPLRFESQSASTSPVAQKSFNFGSAKVDIPVQKSEKQRSVHRGHRRVASASIPLADIGEAVPNSSLSMSERGIAEAASAGSRKARLRAVYPKCVRVCVYLRVLRMWFGAAGLVSLVTVPRWLIVAVIQVVASLVMEQPLPCASTCSELQWHVFCCIA